MKSANSCEKIAKNAELALTNVDVDLKYKEVEDALIENYGEPKSGTLNGKPYKFINQNLITFRKSFHNFISLLQSAKINCNAHSNALLVVLDYCKNDDYLTFGSLVNQLRSKNCSAKALQNLLTQLEQVNELGFDMSRVYQCFAQALKNGSCFNSYRDCHPTGFYDPKLKRVEELQATLDKGNHI